MIPAELVTSADDGRDDGADVDGGDDTGGTATSLGGSEFCRCRSDLSSGRGIVKDFGLTVPNLDRVGNGAGSVESAGICSYPESGSCKIDDSTSSKSCVDGGPFITGVFGISCWLILFVCVFFANFTFFCFLSDFFFALACLSTFFSDDRRSVARSRVSVLSSG